MRPIRLSIAMLTLSTLAAMTGASADDARGDRHSPARAQAAREAAPHAPEIVLYPQYRATGVKDGAALATVVHCTNLGSSLTIFVDMWDFDGTYKCGMSFTAGQDDTYSVASRPVASFTLDGHCTSPSANPGINQGLVEISTPSPSPSILCSVQVMDLAGNPPTSLTTLDLFRP